jgi:hypothetical protein
VSAEIGARDAIAGPRTLLIATIDDARRRPARRDRRIRAHHG